MYTSGKPDKEGEEERGVEEREKEEGEKEEAEVKWRIMSGAAQLHQLNVSAYRS